MAISQQGLAEKPKNDWADDATNTKGCNQRVPNEKPRLIKDGQIETLRYILGDANESHMLFVFCYSSLEVERGIGKTTKKSGMFAHYAHQNTSPSGLLSPATDRQMMNKHAADGMFQSKI